jgi:hypothetical protein
VFDLDPDEGLDFRGGAQGGLPLPRHPPSIGLETFPMVTGGKGVHVVAPLKPRAEWPEVKDFAHRLRPGGRRAIPRTSPPRCPRSAQGPHLRRLSAQPARRDRGHALFGARAARGAGRGPDHLEGNGTIDTPAHWHIGDAAELVKRAHRRRSPAGGAPTRCCRTCEVKIATYNVNGVNGRLPVLLRWLAEEPARHRRPAGVEGANRTIFRKAAIRDLGYDAIWHGQKSWNGVAMLSRVGEIHETRRGLPRRSRPIAEPLHRGGHQRHPDRRSLSAQRQSAAGPQVRL